jgi:hypothetical protein
VSCADIAALAATSGVDLCLDHPDRAAELFGGFAGFLDTERWVAHGHGDAETAEQFFALVFVNLHA